MCSDWYVVVLIVSVFGIRIFRLVGCLCAMIGEVKMFF